MKTRIESFRIAYLPVLRGLLSHDCGGDSTGASSVEEVEIIHS